MKHAKKEYVMQNLNTGILETKRLTMTPQQAGKRNQKLRDEQHTHRWVSSEGLGKELGPLQALATQRKREAGKKPKLPPDPENQNDDRAEWALVAVQAFANETGLNISPESDGIEMAIYDLLADLAHLCDRRGVKLGEMIARAARNYYDETEGQGTQRFDGEGTDGLNKDPKRLCQIEIAHGADAPSLYVASLTNKQQTDLHLALAKMVDDEEHSGVEHFEIYDNATIHTDPVKIVAELIEMAHEDTAYEPTNYFNAEGVVTKRV